MQRFFELAQPRSFRTCRIGHRSRAGRVKPFHELDQRGFRKRGGGSVKCCALQISASAPRPAQRGQAARILVVAAVVAAFLIEREKPSNLTTWPGAQFHAGPAFAAISRVVRSSSADPIWLAMVRIQISS